MQRPLQLQGDRPLADQLAGAFAAMIDEARIQARNAVDAPGQSLHDFRRAVRRAQALVSLTGPMLRKRARKLVTEGLARATRRTRTLRDLDAVMPMVAKLEGADLGPGDTAALASLRGYIESAQAELAGSEITAWRLRKNVRSLAGLDDIFRVGLHQWVENDMLLESLRDHYKDTRTKFREAQKTLRVGDLHTWRKSARTLRYQLELLATANGLEAGIEQLYTTFEKQVKQLGSVTDLMALAAIVSEAQPELLGVDPEALVDKLEALVDARATAAFLDAEITFAVKPKSFAWPSERALPEVVAEVGGPADAAASSAANATPANPSA